MTHAQLLKRIEALEREVESVKSLLAKVSLPPRRTFRDYVGMFRDDPDFREAMLLGAEYRKSLRPKADGRR